jgi:hypothetical protein
MLKDIILYGTVLITILFIVKSYAFEKNCFDSVETISTIALLTESVLVQKLL